MGVLVPNRELRYPVKCLCTVVVHVEPSVSDFVSDLVILQKSQHSPSMNHNSAL